jgi:hypothetical protein
MTCVWNSLIHGLEDHLSEISLPYKVKPYDFVKKIKSLNTLIATIIVDDEELTKKQIQENFDAIKEFKVEHINEGYYCSTCDPYLILICHVFSCSIHHNYNGHIIKYEHVKPRFILHLQSNRSHMTFRKKTIIE